MANPDRRPCLAQEPCLSLGIPRDLRMHPFHGDPLARQLVLGFQNGAHAALTQQAQHSILATKNLAWARNVMHETQPQRCGPRAGIEGQPRRHDGRSIVRGRPS